MRLIFIVMFSLIGFSISAQTDQFAKLKEVFVGFGENLSIRYNPACTQLYNKAIGDLDKGDPLYTGEEYGQEDVKVLKTKIDTRSAEEFIVVFSDLPSADPHFVFYSSTNQAESAFSISCNSIIIPGDGFIYSMGHSNNTIDARKKFVWKDNSLVEVEQPFYFVGMKSKTLEEVIMYDSDNLENVVEVLPANTNIQILLKKKETNLYLIATEFGLTGWIDTGYIGMMPTVIEDLFYSGD